MATYSIDLGIDANATGGAAGTATDPYPLQIALCKGTLTPGSSPGQYTGFTPCALASFDRIQGNDLIIFRIFDITTIGNGGTNSLTGVTSLDATFTMLDGSQGSVPWTEDAASSPGPAPLTQLCLSFGAAGDMYLPCYFQWDSAPGYTNWIVYNTVVDPSSSESYLFSVVVTATLSGLGDNIVYYQADPEMVVSPDNGNVREEAGNTDCVPDQSPVTVAMSR